jgi:hypothetical protein
VTEPDSQCFDVQRELTLVKINCVFYYGFVTQQEIESCATCVHYMRALIERRASGIDMPYGRAG